MKTIQELPTQVDTEALEAKVKKMYRDVALNPEGDFHFEMGRKLAERLGYPTRRLDRIPEPAMDSFAGVGFYFHLADIDPGEFVVDLGSGAGMDAFYAALATGPYGKVLGIDMTEEQLEKSILLALKNGFHHVNFTRAYIEELPIKAGVVDAVISNGVINLSANKTKVFQEAARILKPGGRLAFSDIVSGVELPQSITCNSTLWAACIGGAVTGATYLQMIEEAGLKVIMMEDNPAYQFLSNSAQGATSKYGIKSVSILAIKP
ncbi:MAG: methyltransferase domain-containing protein [Cyanothece sp. SIO1E1]|nr:methyltransferase domain-containing protein [Cyanothece sp. SIO1E1]